MLSHNMSAIADLHIRQRGVNSSAGYENHSKGWFFIFKCTRFDYPNFQHLLLTSFLLRPVNNEL